MKVINNKLVLSYLAKIRDKNTSCKDFRTYIKKLSGFVIYEACEFLTCKKIQVNTPLMPCECEEIAEDIVIVPILRAALGMSDIALDLLENASVGFLGIQRNESTLEPEFFFEKFPQNVDKNTAIIIDPMFATGGSAIAAVNKLKSYGVKKIIFASIIATPIAAQRMKQAHPDVHLITACMDEGLNEYGYIIPGLGDAGDRIFNTIKK